MNLKVKIPGLEFKCPVYNRFRSFRYGEYQWTAFAKNMNFKELLALTLKTSTIKSTITTNNIEKLIYFK